jgi:heavy metal sensor kinase
MTIRNRLTLWFGGILLVSLIVLAGVMHYEWEEQVKRLLMEKQEPEPAWEEVGEVVFVYGGVTALLLLLGSWWLLRKSLAPIITLTRAAERIHVDNLKERLPHTGSGDELERLAEVFNAMMARLEDSFTRVREFTLHASHELKTPLTVMRAEIETALGEDHLTSSQREVFANQLEEIQRLAKIVNSLTFLAKADAGQAALQFESVRLDELVRDSFSDAQVLARPQGIVVELPVCESISLQADRHRLRQLLLNLTDNAIKFNRPEGKVTVALKKHNGVAELKISNTGRGVPPEKLSRVFDRFYRGDAAHGNEVDGCGLGLSIAEWIAKAHRGGIQMVSEPDQWTTIIVTFPLTLPVPSDP